jgi:hypothetical protein
MDVVGRRESRMAIPPRAARAAAAESGASAIAQEVSPRSSASGRMPAAVANRAPAARLQNAAN